MPGPLRFAVFRLSLSLFMARIRANDTDDSLPSHHLALLTAPLDGRLHLHANYLLPRQVILPRVRSYGDNSTVTRSPAPTRIKLSLSLPERCAVTSCPLSSSTRNTALGRTSCTTPSISIVSFFFGTAFSVYATLVSISGPSSVMTIECS